MSGDHLGCHSLWGEGLQRLEGRGQGLFNTLQGIGQVPPKELSSPMSISLSQKNLASG